MESTAPVKKRGRKEYITLLNVMSAVAVVFLHLNGAFWSYSETWAFSNFVECFFYFAVPIFFMISGSTLINYTERYTTKEYFKKRVTKTVIPYIFWDMFALFLCIVYYKSYTLSDISIPFLINGIVGTPFANVYWFFVPLFCVYLCIPVLAAIPKDKRKAVFSYAAIVCFIVNFAVPFFIYVFKLDITWVPSVATGSGHLFFVIVGYLLSEYEIKPVGRIIIYVLGIGGFLIHFLGTYYLTTQAGEIVKSYKGYVKFQTVLYAVAVFLFVKQISKYVMKGWFKKLIDFISGYTFPIYLMHIYFKWIFFDKSPIPTNSPVFIICSPLIIIPCCILITMLLRKIPLIKHIVP